MSRSIIWKQKGSYTRRAVAGNAKKDLGQMKL